MKHAKIDIYEEIVRLRNIGEPAALATIVRRIGSTPRKDSAKMLIRKDGSSLGSIGGGCVEAEVWEIAQRVMSSNRPKILEYEMTDENMEEEGLVCGGKVEVFVEPILVNSTVIILGCGHVGQSISAQMVDLGCRVTVVDDRESFASTDRFPGTERVLIRDFGESLADLKIPQDGFAFIVTRGHRHDEQALASALRLGLRYIGLIGSRRKIKIIVTNLLEQGFQIANFKNLYAPIGIDIGSESPPEIAVSVAAELIAIRKGVHRRSAKQDFIHKFLAEMS
jgi:xanthine dehydrogenase accessory factor